MTVRSKLEYHLLYIVMPKGVPLTGKQQQALVDAASLDQRKLAYERARNRVPLILDDEHDEALELIENWTKDRNDDKSFLFNSGMIGVEPEDESLARIIAVALGFHVDTFQYQVIGLTKSDCFRAADAVLKAGYRRMEGNE